MKRVLFVVACALAMATAAARPQPAGACSCPPDQEMLYLALVALDPETLPEGAEDVFPETMELHPSRLVAHQMSAPLEVIP